MVDAIGVAFILVGVVVLFAGAALSVYGVGILGAVVGGALGFLLAPSVGVQELVPMLGITGAGVLAGLIGAYLLLSLVVAVLGFVTGAYIGLHLAPLVLGGEAGILGYGVVILCGVVGAGIAPMLTRTLLVLITSFFGAAIASGQLTLADIGTAQADLQLDPILVDAASPLLLLLFVVGVLFQLGLFRFGHVAKIAAILPGASVLTDRRGGSTEATADD